MKHTCTTDICDDVDQVVKSRCSGKNDDLRVPEIIGNYCRSVANLEISFQIHSPAGRSFENFNSCTVLKHHVPVHVKHGNAFLYPEASIHACTL